MKYAIRLQLTDDLWLSESTAALRMPGFYLKAASKMYLSCMPIGTLNYNADRAHVTTQSFLQSSLLTEGRP